MEHPGGEEGAPAAHDVRHPALALEHFEGGPGEPAVHGNEIYAVRSLLFDHIEDALHAEVYQPSLIVDRVHDHLVDRHRSHGHLGPFDHLSSAQGDVTPCGKVHHAVCTGLNSHIHFGQFVFQHSPVRRGPDVGIDFDEQAFTYAAGVEPFVVHI